MASGEESGGASSERVGTLERWLRSPRRLALLVAVTAVVATLATSLGEIELQRAAGFDEEPGDVLWLSGATSLGWALAAWPTILLARALVRARLPLPAIAAIHLAVAGAAGCVFLVGEIRVQQWIQGEEETASAARFVAWQERSMERDAAFLAMTPEEREAFMERMRRGRGRGRGDGRRRNGDRADSDRSSSGESGERGGADSPQPPPGDGERAEEDGRRGDDGARRGERSGRGATGGWEFLSRTRPATTVNLATGDLAADFERRWPLRVPRYGLVYLAIVGLGLGVRAYLTGRDREREAGALQLRAAELESALTQARLDALRGQLHPHFLFNALHSVGGLIRAGQRPEALTALDSIGDLLRTSLDAGGEQFVTLERELDLVRRYLGVETLRLGDRLVTRVEAPDELLECEVPAFITQPLVENAVKHGVAPRPTGGTVSVRAFALDADTLVIEIEDDGAGLGGGVPARSGGVGVGHVRERLATLFEDAAALEFTAGADGRGTVARLTLPRDDAPLDGAEPDAAPPGAGAPRRIAPDARESA